MPTAPLQFGMQESGNQQLSGAPPLAVNVVIDGSGALRRRPGIATWAGFPSTVPEVREIEGITSFDDEVYWVTSTRQLWRTDPDTATATALSDGTAAALLAGSARPVFAETKTRLVIAGGDVPEKVDIGESLAERLGGSPPVCTNVIALASRLFVNDKTSNTTKGHIRYSGTGVIANESWDALDYAEAEARPDDIVALRENSNEAFAWGETTLQVFSPDPIGVIAPGRALNIGCSAAHSVIRADEAFGWLDDQRRLVVSDGRGVDELSAPISGTLDGINTVSDCYGFRVNADQFDCLVWQFPTDGRTFVNAGAWSQWQGWDASVGSFTALGIKAHYFWPAQNLHLVGLATGQIAKLDYATSTDLGTEIKAEAWTGFQDQGTDEIKHCTALHLAFKRGQSSTAPEVRISWRDDLGAFCSPIRVSLGVTGDSYPVVELRSLGTYRRRQWKFEFSDAADLVLASARETFSVGRAGRGA